jgi:hypothetical protein
MMHGTKYLSPRDFLMAGCLVASGLALHGIGNAQEPEPHHFLRTQAGFSEAELHEMDRGKVLVKSPSTDLENEIVLVGAVLIEASTEFFLRMYRDIERFEGGLGPIKKLGDPPRPEDFETMMLPEEDLKDLGKCRLGDCDLKIGENGLSRLQQDVDWDAPDALDQAMGVVRELFNSFSKAYREGGNQALGVNRDSKKPTFVAEEFEELIQNSPYILHYVPELHHYLLDYPQASFGGAEDFMYWALNDFGIKHILRLSHVTIYQEEEDANASAVIASKQLYFTRYFHTGLDLRFLVENRQRPGSDSFYLVTVSRLRSNDLGGLFGGVVRQTAQAAARDGLKLYMEVCKEAVDRYYRER